MAKCTQPLTHYLCKTNKSKLIEINLRTSKWGNKTNAFNKPDICKNTHLHNRTIVSLKKKIWNESFTTSIVIKKEIQEIFNALNQSLIQNT
jgi:hypothetical protein